MGFLSSILTLSLALFAGMLACLELGRRLGRGPLAGELESTRTGVAAAQGVVFALMGLLIAFSFSGAASRFEERRALVTTEANAVSTAWRLLDLLPESARAEARASFRAYLDARLAAYAALPDLAAARAELARASVHEQELWDRARSGAAPGSDAARLALPALTTVFDVAAARTNATQRHPPRIVLALLFFLALACALMAGHAMRPAARRPIGHMLAYAGVIALTVYVILDLEYPRLGWIRIDSADQLLLDVRAWMDR